MKLLRLSKKESFILKYKITSVWFTYMGERKTIFGLANGIKLRCYWELFGEHVRNLGTLCFEPPLYPFPLIFKKKKNLHVKLIIQVESE
jgi:hypothetical protein